MNALKKSLLYVLLPLGLLVAIYAAAGYWLVPYLAVKYLPDIVAEQIGLKPTLKALRFDPFALKLEVQDFALPNQDGQNMISFSGLRVDVNGWDSIKQSGVVLDDITLSKPVVLLQRDAEGKLNVQQVQPVKTEQSPEPQPNKQPLLVVIHQLVVAEGNVDWKQADGKQLNLLPVDLKVFEFTTQLDNKPNFELSLDLATGGHLHWQGNFALTPVSSIGQIKLDAVQLNPLWISFLHDLLPITLVDGQLKLDTQYNAQMAETGFSLLLTQASLNIQKLDIQDKKHPGKLIEITGLSADGIEVDTTKQLVNIKTISSQEGSVKVWLQKDGELNYAALFAGEGAAKNATPAAQSASKANKSANDSPKTPAWRVLLNEIQLNGYQINFTDNTLKQPVTMIATDLAFNLQNYDLLANNKLPIQFSSKINKEGSLKFNGFMHLKPFEFVSDLDIKNIALKKFQSYVDPFIKLDIIDGELNTQGHFDLHVEKDVKMHFQGDVAIEHFITRDQVKNKDFVKWANLGLSQLELDIDKQVYKLGSVTFDRPYFRFFIKKDGKTNIDDILPVAAEAKTTEESKKTVQTAEAKTEQPKISISQIILKNGESDFADYSLILPFVVQMNTLNGQVDGFSSSKDAVAKLKLSGKVYDMATVAIHGQYQLQNGDSDINLNYKHMPLPLVTPYMAQFSGYKIEKGQMALDLHYSIKQGQLEMENKILIDQLALGEKVENPDAVSLPLELAIALLKDGDGKIKLDFPISGSLNDPQFSIGALIMDVLENVLSKVVTSPFKAIASLANEDADMSEVLFSAGYSELGQEQSAKLDQIAKALAERPQLNLDIKGLSFQIFDWPVLRTEAVRFILKRMKSGELRDKGERVRAENIELDDSEYKRLLAKFYAEVLPTEIDYGLLGKPRMKHNPDVDFYETARMQLEAILQPEPERLEALSVARANSIAKYLSEHSQVDRSKLYILATEQLIGKPEDTVHATLSLSVAH